MRTCTPDCRDCSQHLENYVCICYAAVLWQRTFGLHGQLSIFAQPFQIKTVSSFGTYIYIYCDFEDVHLVLDVGAFFTWWRRFRFFTRRHLDDRTRFAKQALLHLLAFSLWPTPGSF